MTIVFGFDAKILIYLYTQPFSFFGL